MGLGLGMGVGCCKPGTASVPDPFIALFIAFTLHHTAAGTKSTFTKTFFGCVARSVALTPAAQRLRDAVVTHSADTRDIACVCYVRSQSYDYKIKFEHVKRLYLLPKEEEYAHSFVVRWPRTVFEKERNKLECHGLLTGRRA